MIEHSLECGGGRWESGRGLVTRIDGLGLVAVAVLTRVALAVELVVEDEGLVLGAGLRTAFLVGVGCGGRRWCVHQHPSFFGVRGAERRSAGPMLRE